MNLSDNFKDSFEYAKKLFSNARRLIILIVLSIIPIVDWIVIGYQARVLRESPGTGTPPKLEKYGELFVDGAKVFFATVIYMIIPLILIAVGGVSTSAGLMPTSGAVLAGGFVLGGAGAVILLVGIILMVLLLIILAVGVAHMVKTGKFGKAFAVRRDIEHHARNWLGEVHRVDSRCGNNRLCNYSFGADTSCRMADLAHYRADPRRLRFQINGIIVQ